MAAKLLPDLLLCLACWSITWLATFGLRIMASDLFSYKASYCATTIGLVHRHYACTKLPRTRYPPYHLRTGLRHWFCLPTSSVFASCFTLHGDSNFPLSRHHALPAPRVYFPFLFCSQSSTNSFLLWSSISSYVVGTPTPFLQPLTLCRFLEPSKRFVHSGGRIFSYKKSGSSPRSASWCFANKSVSCEFCDRGQWIEWL